MKAGKFARLSTSPSARYSAIAFITIWWLSLLIFLLSFHSFPHGFVIPSEPVFLNVYGAQESIPRDQFRQAM
jgi:hypothetical protein